MGYGLLDAFAALQAVPACEVNFIGQTVATDQTINSCDVNILYTTVQNNSKLTINAENETTIFRTFEVKLGSQLEVNAQ